MQLKKLNTALFPVHYNNKYYQDAIASKDFSKLAYYSDICVGAIACRLEKKEGGAVCVYIMILDVLAPYRGLGLGTGDQHNDNVKLSPQFSAANPTALLRPPWLQFICCLRYGYCQVKILKAVEPYLSGIRTLHENMIGIAFFLKTDEAR